MVEDIKKEIEKAKDKKTPIQMRLYDFKHNRVVYKTLTVKELVAIEAYIKLEWHDLKKEGKENV
jgi:hypothetical protein